MDSIPLGPAAACGAAALAPTFPKARLSCFNASAALASSAGLGSGAGGSGTCSAASGTTAVTTSETAECVLR